MPAPGVSLPELDAAVDRVLNALIAEGVEAKALELAKTRLVADAIYAQDSQAALARWYGAALATGQTIRDVQEWPERIEAVGAEACSPRRASGSRAAAGSPDFCCRRTTRRLE